MFFFFNDTATTEIYTLSLHDALPISAPELSPKTSPKTWWNADNTTEVMKYSGAMMAPPMVPRASNTQADRKSTRLNSSHANISYAVFCLKKKKTNIKYAFLNLKKR